MKKVYLVAPKKLGTIAPEIYGHFAEHIGGVFYDGMWVGKDSDIPNIRGFRKDLVEKLKAINPPVLRWPGGCFAETYDWRDGIGEDRPTRIGWWTIWDGKYEPNAVGTHEFVDLCEIIGAKPYFAANLTSVTPLHIRDWMDYCLSPRGTTTLAKEREKNGHPEPFDIPYWGVGNENWGGGGHMRPEYYADECRKFAEVMYNVSDKVQLYACGTNAAHHDWALRTIPILNYSFHGRHPICGFAMHYYCGNAGDPVAFTEDEWTELLEKAQKMEDIVLRNWNIICANDAQDHIKLVVDEWGCWHQDGSGPNSDDHLFEQQSTMRDAMVAALTLHIFNRHCDKILMANVAQVNNNLHSLFLSHEDKCFTTPTYHVFDMFKGHQGAEAIDTVVTNNEEFAKSLTVSASRKDGKLLVTIGNLSCTEDAEITLENVGINVKAEGFGRMLAHEDMHAHNTFEAPDTVTPTSFTFDATKPLTIPKAGIVALELTEA